MRIIEDYWWLWLLIATLPGVGLLGLLYLDSLFVKLDFYFGRKVIAYIFLITSFPPVLVSLLLLAAYYFSWLSLFLIALIKIIRYAVH